MATKSPPAKPCAHDPEERVNLIHRDGPIEAALRVRDRTVLEYDSRWGADVLQTLVSPETAAKFARVRDRLDTAIRAGDVDTAINTMAVEMRGLEAMEREAIAAGRKPLDPGRCWAFQLVDGTQALAVQTDDDARAANRSPRFTGWAIYSMREIGVILSDRALLGVIDAKKAFPDAKLEAIKPAPDWKRGDEMPF